MKTLALVLASTALVACSTGTEEPPASGSGGEPAAGQAAGRGGSAGQSAAGGSSGVVGGIAAAGFGGGGAGGASGGAGGGTSGGGGVSHDAGAVDASGGAGGAPPVIAPLPPVPATEQLAVVKRIAASVCRAVVTFDAADNVVAINVSNHSVVCGGSGASGLTDGQAQELLKFPELRRVRFEGMPLSPVGYAVLAKLPKLESALFHYTTKDPAFMLSVKDQVGLKHLELKHLFSVVGTRLADLPAYPELRILELDVISANRVQAVPLIKKHPKLLSLQLHRTNITNDDIAEIVAAAPDLEGLELKPSGSGMDAGVFVHVGKLKKLRVLQLVGLSVPGWEAGGKHLADLSQLQVIVGGVAGDTAAELRKRNPGIGIGGPATPEQRSLTDKDNPYFLKTVSPWFSGRKQEYRGGALQAGVGSEDIG